MLIAKDIKKLFGELNLQEDTYVTVDGSDILIHFEQEKLNLSLRTTVYNGGNYIPSSVRHCLSHRFPHHYQSIDTYLTLDELNFQIQLNYKNKTNEPLSLSLFKELLEEFGSIAEMWRARLDEHDRNDLVYVKVR